jgi:predicted enzyme related to lactoylglutathione lyase
MTMNPVVHFEMPASDNKRAKKFYEKAFKWKMEQLGPEMGNYLLATTSPVDKKGMHKRKGAINGGFFKKGKSGTVPHLVIAISSIENQMKIVRKSGGKVLGKPMEIPGIGIFVMFKDSEGNRVGLLQPYKM